MKTKLFTLLFAIVAGVGTMLAWDYEQVQIGDLYYSLNETDLTAEVARTSDNYEGLSEAIIPASVTYNDLQYRVTSIALAAFYDLSNLTSVSIGNNVTNIGEHAFENCSNLASVTMGNSVTNIGERAFFGCSSLTSIEIPNSVTSIAQAVFGECRSLTSITIPDNVTSIGIDAFYACTGLTSVTFGNNVAIIDIAAFRDCSSLTSVTIPNSVTIIGEEAFRGCSGLTSIEIPNSVTSIGKNAFYDCSGLTSVTIGNGVISIGYSAFAGCSGLTSLTIPNSVTHIGTATFDSCTGLTSLTIGNSVTVIEYNAFQYCTGLTSITCTALNPPTLWSSVFMGIDMSIPLYVPSGSISAYQAAYQWNEFTNIQAIPEEEMIDPGHPLNPGNYRVTLTVDDEAKGSVSGSGMYPHGSVVTIEAIPNTCYEFVEWSDGVTENPRTFSLMEDVTLSPTWAMTILASGFCGNEDDNMTWELTCDSILSIRGTGVMMDFAYGDNTSEWKTYSDKIKHVVFSEGVTKIGDHAFMNCYNLASVRFPNTMTNIGWSSFKGCSSLISVIVPEGVTYISYATFSNCSSLTSITLPSSLTSIADFAFSGCTALATITIPRNVTDLYHSVFSSCTGLTSITCEAVIPPTMVNDAFYNVDRTISLYVPALSMPVYKVTERWKEFLNIQTLETAPTYTHVKIGALYYNLYANSLTAEVTYDQHWYNSNYSGLQNISIPNAVVYSGKTYNVVRIGVEAFGPCTSLSTVTIPSSIKTIGKNAFYNCVALTNVNMSEGLVYMDDGVFSGCSQLTSVTIPQSVAYMGTTMFHSCTKLRNVTLPDGLESVGYQMFYRCSGLSNMVLPDSVRQIGNYAFSGCSSMTAIYIPEHVRSIGMGAFSNCSGLRAIELPEEIESIDYVAFKGCTGLTSFTCNAITPPSLTCPVFEDVNTSIPLNVPCASIPQYRATFCWNNFTNIQAIDTIVITPYLSSVNPNNGSVNIVERSRIACDTLLLTIKADPSDGYDFLQWSDGNTDNPRSLILIHDTVITAEWVKTYIITWQNADSTILANDTVRESATPAYSGETPTKDATAQYTYTFNGWSPDIVAATADATYTATYSATLNEYTVSGEQNISALAVGANTHIIVGNQGHLIVDVPATIGCLTLTMNGTTAAQVTGIEDLTASTIDAIFTVRARQWFALGVPFDVNVATGIRINGANAAANYGTDYVMDEYDGALRASTQDGWKRVASSETLHPGKLYMIYTASATTWRLTAANPAVIAEAESVAVAANQSSFGDHHAGWNGIAIHRWTNASASLNGVNYATLYNNQHSVYAVVPMAEKTFIPAEPFFVQTPAAGSVLFADDAAPAPWRVTAATEMPTMTVALTNEVQTFTDKAYISMAQDKPNTYLIGHDLEKMQAAAPAVPQLWIEAYNMHLAAYETSLIGNQQIIPLGLYAPTEGYYTIALDNAPADKSITLLRNDQPVWNLSESACVALLQAGNNADYALRISQKSDVVTDLNTLNGGSAEVHKRIIDNQLYILRDGKTYTVQGWEVK